MVVSAIARLGLVCVAVVVHGASSTTASIGCYDATMALNVCPQVLVIVEREGSAFEEYTHVSMRLLRMSAGKKLKSSTGAEDT